MPLLVARMSQAKAMLRRPPVSQPIAVRCFIPHPDGRVLSGVPFGQPELMPITVP